MSDDRVFLLNAVWFKPDGGEKKYRRYLRKATPIMEEVGGRRLKSFVPERSLVGEFDADLVFFLEFPTWDAYKQFATSPAHHKIAYLRTDSVANTILVRCKRPTRSYK